MILRGPFQKVLILLLTIPLYHGALEPMPGFCGEPDARITTLPVVTPDHSSRDLLRGLAQIVPPGWNLMKAVKRFMPKNLWQQIDGRAEFFLSYDMVQMTLAEYTDPSKAETFIDVSIHDMGNPSNAFGVFSAERQEDIHPVDLGREAYRSGANLFIWKGPYYVRMIASDDTQGLLKNNLALAERLMELLHDSGESVWGLETLPSVDRVTGSEQ
jgi:hypothetical protein